MPATGETVRLIVSTGPESATVPGVVGDAQGDATDTLTDAGFDVTVVQVPSTPANMGKVIAQSPNGGSTANKGSTVVITVGTGPGGTTTTT